MSAGNALIMRLGLDTGGIKTDLKNAVAMADGANRKLAQSKGGVKAANEGWLESERRVENKIVGGTIPPEDENTLKQCGVAAIYTPKNYELNRILADIVRVVDSRFTKAA